MGEQADGTVIVVLTGVTGVGKTTVMEELERRLGWPAAEGDSFHPKANVEKMRSGHPLDDADRWPWLEAVAAWIGDRERARENALVTCSALKRSYRDLLLQDHPSVWFACLVAPSGMLEARLERRAGHYMPAALLASQLAAVEPLAADEPGAVIDAVGSPDAVADRVLEGLSSQRRA